MILLQAGVMDFPGFIVAIVVAFIMGFCWEALIEWIEERFK